MRDYELTYIVSPEVAEEEVSAVIEKLNRLITNAQGEVGEVNPWGRRKLAYPIKQFRDGYYVTVRFKLAAQAAGEVERGLKLTEEVIRYLLVKGDRRGKEKAESGGIAQ